MKIALPCKVSKTAVDLLGSSAPARRSEAIALLAKALSVPSSNSQATAKNSSSTRRFHRQILKNRNCFPQTSNGKPGSFNPELCGGSLPSETLAR